MDCNLRINCNQFKPSNMHKYSRITSLLNKEFSNAVLAGAQRELHYHGQCTI